MDHLVAQLLNKEVPQILMRAYEEYENEERGLATDFEGTVKSFKDMAEALVQDKSKIDYYVFEELMKISR